MEVDLMTGFFRKVLLQCIMSSLLANSCVLEFIIRSERIIKF